MSSLDRGPRQLAEAVLRALSLAVVDVPMPSALALFFDVLYEASFRLERGQPITCSLLWQEPDSFPNGLLPLGLNSSQGAPHEETWKRPGRSYVAFTTPLPFSVSSVLALSRTLEPGASALAVYGLEGQAPVIHGLVNYGADSSQNAPAEWEAQAGVCGSFRATIVGPAHITVDAGLDYPIELKRNTLRAHSYSVLRQGPVRDCLSGHLRGLTDAVQAQLSPDLLASSYLEAKAIPLKDGSVLIHEFDWSETLERLWLNALTRILLKIRENGQGGALLITPNVAEATDQNPRLKIPYALEYFALREALEKRGAYWMTQFIHSAKALSEQPLTVREMRPDDLALPEPDPRSGPLESDQEIHQAITFIASLARMDGILLLTPQMEMYGFGGQPVEDNRGGDVYLAGNEQASDSSLSAVPGHAFGPRCQALLRQCSQDPEAVGFFLTQDGDLRAMKQMEEKIIVWDPVRLNRD